METNKDLKKIVLCILLFIVGKYYSQTNTENYIQTRAYLVPVTSTNSSAKQIETIQYIDGLGRSKQVVNVKASPTGKDIVNHIEYDQYGRKAKEYLPIPQSGTQNGEIYTSPLSNTNTIYGTEKIYSEKVYDDSPFNRIYQQIQVGNDWANKPVNFGYDVNAVADGVRRFTTLTTVENGATKSVLEENSLYTNGQLYKNNTIDEDGNTNVEFKNAKGQLILSRKVVNVTENADTYYVYNEYDQLAFIIPPMASIREDIASNTTKQDELCYYYRYDGKSRLVEKKLPGKGWEYMVYDKQDRLVLTQDANLRKKGQWLFIKYDQFSRQIYTGILDSPPGRIQQLAVIEGHSSNYETRNTSSWNNSGLDIFYTNTHAYPTANFKVLSVNYYDTYPNYNFNPPFPANIQGEIILSDNTSDNRNTRGMPVMNLIKNIEDDNWTKNYTYYDTKARIIGTHSINHLGGYTRTESKLDFTGIPQTVFTKHKRLNTDSEKIITEVFEYDSQNRLLTHTHQIDNNPVEILTRNKYNELSQIEIKKVGGSNISQSLQTVDYKYNIRGWLTQVNDPTNLGNDLFGYKINYNKVEGLEIPNADYPDLKIKPKYNGNIAEVSWKTLTEQNEPLKTYGYVHDALNRLSAGFYQKVGNENAKEYFEKIEYDLNGNIIRLKRSGGIPQGGNIALAIDNLKYDYLGNKLIRVTDEQQNPSGYPYFFSPNIIGYDNDNGEGNGNMISHLDQSISSIQYNYLNLPNKITQNSKIIDYTYTADGVKVKKLFGDIETDYLDIFQYKSTKPSEESLDGELIIEDPNEVAEIKLRIIPTSEGYYDALNKQYIYNFTDHLGNVRLSYTDTNKDGYIQPRRYHWQECDTPQGPWDIPNCIDGWRPGEIVEVNNYYPFGLLHNYTSTTKNAYQYKFQGQELQETGWYSFKWRNYMPELGRFFNIDPLSEDYAYQSHYNFSENRVVDGVELEGLEAFPFEILLDNAGIEPLSSGLEPLLEPKMPVEPMAEPPMEAVPSNIDNVELVKLEPHAFEPAGIEMKDFKIVESLEEMAQEYEPLPDEIVGPYTRYNAGKFSRYQDITGTKNAKNNKATDVTKQEFENNLEAEGFQKTQIGNGMNRFSNEKSSYTTRDFSKQGKPTADYRSNPDGKGPTEIKIRLEP